MHDTVSHEDEDDAVCSLLRDGEGVRLIGTESERDAEDHVDVNDADALADTCNVTVTAAAAQRHETGFGDVQKHRKLYEA